MENGKKGINKEINRKKGITKKMGKGKKWKNEKYFLIR